MKCEARRHISRASLGHAKRQADDRQAAVVADLGGAGVGVLSKPVTMEPWIELVLDNTISPGVLLTAEVKKQLKDQLMSETDNTFALLTGS